MKKILCAAAILIVLFTGCDPDPAGDGQDPSGDTTAPSGTVITVITAGSGKISLSWSEPSDTDYDHLLLSWTPGGTDGTEIDKGTTSYEITGLSNGTEYTLTGKTVDTSGNVSAGCTISILVPEDEMDIVYISTAAELAAIDDAPEALNDYYIFTADIDLEGISWTPLASLAQPFTGILDGSGFTVQHLSVDTSGTYLGLFAYLGSGSLVRNLTVAGGVITGGDTASEWLGLISAYIFEGVIDGCIVSGSVTGLGSSPYAGGIAGGNEGDIIGSSSSAEVTGTGGLTTSYSGGLVGINLGNIEGCSASGDVTGSTAAGGLAGGSSTAGTITDSRASGDVTASGGSYGGGLAGISHGSIDGCHASGAVNGDSLTGGLVGWTDGGTITGSYALGIVTGSGADIGGLVGRAEADGEISGCHAGGAVQNTGDNTGGLAGYTESPVSESWAEGSVESTAGSYAGGLIGYTTQSVSRCWAEGSVTTRQHGSRRADRGHNSCCNRLLCLRFGKLQYVRRRTAGILLSGATADNCYAFGFVTASSSPGGLLGGTSGTVTDSFYDSETSGYDAAGGADGL